MRPDGDVLPRRHFVAHEILKDYADFAMQVLDAVLAQVDAIEQNAPLGRIVEARQELDDGGLALPVLADERDALTGSIRRSSRSSTRRELPG